MDIIDGTKYFSTMKEFEAGMRAGLEGYLKCGKAISVIKSERLWMAEGNHVKSFAHFCKKILHISASQAHRMAQVYTEFGDLLSLPENQMDITKLTLLLPYVHGQDDQQKADLLAMAKDLTIEDLKNNLLEKDGKGILATDVCDHPMDQLKEYTRCEACGKWLK